MRRSIGLGNAASGHSLQQLKKLNIETPKASKYFWTDRYISRSIHDTPGLLVDGHSVSCTYTSSSCNAQPVVCMRTISGITEQLGPGCLVEQILPES